MSVSSEEPGGSCATGCGECRAPDGRVPVSGGLTGWRLAVSAMGVFLVPLVGALLGVVLAGGGEGRKLLAALGGLMAGLAAGGVISRVVSRTRKGPVWEARR